MREAMIILRILSIHGKRIILQAMWKNFSKKYLKMTPLNFEILFF
jgi:hypothetical protein